LHLCHFVDGACIASHPATQRALTHFSPLKKSQKNGGGQNITPLFWGTFDTKKACFGLVFKIWAGLRRATNRRPLFSLYFSFQSYYFFNCIALEMSQKNNSGREFTVDLGDA